MDQLQYRIQTGMMDEPTAWRDISPEELDPNMRWDYRGDVISIRFFELRIKPDFVPGYYQRKAGITPNASAVYMTCADALEAYAADECLLPEDYVRVNVTPAE